MPPTKKKVSPTTGNLDLPRYLLKIMSPDAAETPFTSSIYIKDVCHPIIYIVSIESVQQRVSKCEVKVACFNLPSCVRH